MRFLLLFTLLFSVLACDVPERTRLMETGGGVSEDFLPDGVSYIDANGVQYDLDGNPITTNTVPDEGTIDPSDDPTTTPGFESCSLGMQNYGGPHIGYFGVCQSSQNESIFKVKMAEADPTIGTCFVPIHIIGQTSFKLGIAECVHNQANKTYDMTLTKERAELINGVMVIKAGLAVSGYMQCMNAKINFMQGFPIGSSVDQQCLMQAQGNPDAYAFCVCTKFKGAFSTYYKQVPL